MLCSTISLVSVLGNQPGDLCCLPISRIVRQIHFKWGNGIAWATNGGVHSRNFIELVQRNSRQARKQLQRAYVVAKCSFVIFCALVCLAAPKSVTRVGLIKLYQISSNPHSPIEVSQPN